MSSNIFIQRICEECGKEFTARTTVTRYCGDRCAKRAYKKRIRKSNIEQSNKETAIKATYKTDAAKNKEYLSTKDVCLLIGISRTTLWRLLKEDRIQSKKIGRKLIFSKKNIDHFMQKL